MPDACNHSLDSGKTGHFSTLYRLRTGKIFSRHCQIFLVKEEDIFGFGLHFRRKADAVESATANEDDLSRFMSKLQLFFFLTISMKVLTSGWDVQRQSAL